MDRLRLPAALEVGSFEGGAKGGKMKPPNDEGRPPTAPDNNNDEENIPDANDNAKLEAALSYAQRGWRVFPLHTPTGRKDRPCSCNEPGCKHVGKHPRTMHGLKDGTTDETTIREWWRRWPDANVGIATGGASGIFALDIDGATGEHALKVNGYELPETFEVRTGRKDGRHLYFQAPAWPVRCVTGLLQNVDVKGNGGYVVAAPSLHTSGRRYEVIDPDAELAPAPEWLLTLLKERHANNTPRQEQPLDVADEVIPSGRRNATLTKLAGVMLQRGLSKRATLAALLAENEACCAPPLPETEVRKVFESVASREDKKAQEKCIDIDMASLSLCEGKSDLVALERAKSAVAAGNVPPLIARYDDNRLILLACICRELHAISLEMGFPSFFLTCDNAARMLGLNNAKVAHRMYMRLERDGFLVCVERGNRNERKATRYIFVAEPDARKDSA